MMANTRYLALIRAAFFKQKRQITPDLSRVDETPAELPSPPVFVVGTGRNGTHFFAKIMTKNPDVFAVHLDTFDHAVADSFVPYIIWNRLPVDLLPIKEYRRRLIQYAANRNQLYFESNPYLSLLSDKLIEWFQARLILLIRNPTDVTNSHYVKGWYRQVPPRSDLDAAPGYWPELTANRFFGRLMPNGEEFSQWNKMTRIGKIAWWWKTLNVETIKRLENMPEENFRIIKIENFNHDRYCDLCRFLGTTAALSPRGFEKLRHRPPGKGLKKKSSASWTAKERSEFIEQTNELAKQFGY